MLLHHRVYGSGAPLFVLHGLLGCSDNWHSVARALGRRFTVVVPDLRNHGRSFHHESFTYAELMDDVVRLMSRFGVTQAPVIGHSMGGKLAMNLALTQPERVARLIVVDIAPRSYPPLHTEILTAMLGANLATAKRRSDVEAQLAACVPDARIRQFLLKNLARRRRGGFRWRANIASLQRHYAHVLDAQQSGTPFTQPTLFLRGGRSDYIESGDLDGIVALFPKAVVETVTKAGHWVHADTPEAFVRAVLTFLT